MPRYGRGLELKKQRSTRVLARVLRRFLVVLFNDLECFC
jgi:hypothetical protein